MRNEDIKVTGSIVTYNNIDTIEKCIQSILQHSGKYEIKLFVLDNSSTDGTADRIERKFPEVEIIRNEGNVGFGAGHNQVIPFLKGGYHFIVNPDIYIEQDVIADLVDYMNKNPDAGMVTPKILNSNGSEQYLPQRYPSISYVLISKIPFFRFYRDAYVRKLERSSQAEKIEFCTGCFFCIKNDLLKKLNGFDKAYFMYFEDADLSKRVNQVSSVLYYPEASVFHYWKRDNIKTINGNIRYLKSMVHYFKKWGWKF